LDFETIKVYVAGLVADDEGFCPRRKEPLPLLMSEVRKVSAP